MDVISKELSVEYLVGKYLDDIVRFSFIYTHDYDDAEDTAQQVFFICLNKKPQFQNEKHAKNWLLKVAANISKNKLRDSNNTLHSELHDNISLPEPPERSEAEEKMIDAVMNLKSHYREVIHLYYYEEYSTNEIAQILGVNSATVRTRLARARGLLKKYLKGAGIYE